MQSLQLLISTLKQTHMVCIFNAVTTGNITKLVTFIHLVKTNQHLTVFQATKRIKRMYFAKASKVAVPAVFITANTCAKSVQTRSFFWSVFSSIQSKYGKIQTRKYLESFHAVNTLLNIINLVGKTFNFGVFEKK